MMSEYMLYIKPPTHVENATDFKIGICATNLTRNRLKSYQNAIGPTGLENFVYAWVGDKIDITEAETEIHKKFDDRIDSQEGGFKEWISNTTLQELLDFIEELKSEYFLKLNMVPNNLQPINMYNVHDFMDWLEKGG